MPDPWETDPHGKDEVDRWNSDDGQTFDLSATARSNTGKEQGMTEFENRSGSIVHNCVRCKTLAAPGLFADDTPRYRLCKNCEREIANRVSERCAGARHRQPNAVKLVSYHDLMEETVGEEIGVAEVAREAAFVQQSLKSAHRYFAEFNRCMQEVVEQMAMLSEVVDEWERSPHMAHRETHWFALDPKVLVVAIFNLAVGDWAAYVGAVPGVKHEDEWEEVARTGTKIAADLAEMLFASHLAIVNEARVDAGQATLQWRD